MLGFFCNDTATTEIYTYLHTLSLHDALPIYHLHLEAEAARHGGEALHLQQAVGRAGEAQAAYLFPVDGLPGLRLQPLVERSEEHTSELQSLMRISYAVFCLKKKKKHNKTLHKPDQS